MKIAIFGTGYVGLVTGACLANVGHNVLCIDTDKAKIAALLEGVVPFHEPGLDALVRDNTAAGRLYFSTSVEAGAAFGDVLFIAVGTPQGEDGSADLQYVLAVAASIGQYMTADRIVVSKSTVPVGTADRIGTTVQAELDKRGAGHRFETVSNPEFLKAGAAVTDFMKPDRIVIGTTSLEAERTMRALYAPFNRNHERIVAMDIRSAELTKYAASAMLAAKITLMNEMANIAERMGADIEKVRSGIGADPRIGYDFIYAGCGYGGSCFPKDVRALSQSAAEHGYDAALLRTIDAVNELQKERLFAMICAHYGGTEALKGRVFALWGLAFKPNTDDMRAAPSRILMEALWEAGAVVQAYDPAAMAETARLYGARDDLILCASKEAAVQGADALVICTDWRAFHVPDFDTMDSLHSKTVFDGRNLYDPSSMEEHGFAYYGIGRGKPSPSQVHTPIDTLSVHRVLVRPQKNSTEEN